MRKNEQTRMSQERMMSQRTRICTKLRIYYEFPLTDRLPKHKH